MLVDRTISTDFPTQNFEVVRRTVPGRFVLSVTPIIATIISYESQLGIEGRMYNSHLDPVVVSSSSRW